MSGNIVSTGNPLVDQGTLNRLRGSVVIPNFATLNVTSPYLGRAGISMAIEGETTLFIPTMTGSVTSPEPYQMVSVVINLLKSQVLAASYKAQMEKAAKIGDFTVYPDASSLPTYQIRNGAIMGVRDMSFAGDDAGFVVTLRGYYSVNSDLWNLV